MSIAIFILYTDLLPHATVFPFDMFLFFTRKKWKQLLINGILLLKKPDIFIHLKKKKTDGTTHKFFCLHYHPLFSSYIESLAIFCKMLIKATEENVTKQNYWTL